MSATHSLAPFILIEGPSKGIYSNFISTRFSVTAVSQACASCELLTSPTHNDSTWSQLRRSRLLNSHSNEQERVHNLQDLSNLAWLSLSGCPSLSLQSGALLPLTGLRTLHLADLGWTQLDRCNLDCESKIYIP